uniref:Uncharacterized protein n=2 Tax=Vibrio TaxID=662 RepID=A0A0H3ZLU2_9VIBR|nr:hypothetical protein [Vibrio cyclitrophicus]AKN38226.1 hypothetical protein [Vibrio splendidus]
MLSQCESHKKQIVTTPLKRAMPFGIALFLYFSCRLFIS